MVRLQHGWLGLSEIWALHTKIMLTNKITQLKSDFNGCDTKMTIINAFVQNMFKIDLSTVPLDL